MKQLHGGKLREALGLVKPEPSEGARKVRKSSAGSSRRKRGAPEGELTT
jgi:hypothetical protein